ncbi:MAG: GNAT family N-acetyltransferase [Armatimonadetes bacterium]|nr:GNAT family N-acetyltransferase [Armatimonadota bacterium]
MALEVVAKECVEDQDLEAGLALKAEIFFRTTLEDWKRGEPRTASIAFLGDAVVGFIPLALRPFKLAPGVVISTAFEHCVGTRKEYRGMGIGTAMIEAARGFLEGRAHALCVYRGHERSAAYNFYAKTGHHDLHYVRRLRSAGRSFGPQEGVELTRGLPPVPDLGSRMLAVYESAHSRYGGYPVRAESSWKKADNRGYWNFWASENGRLLGHLLTRERNDIPLTDGKPGKPILMVMEMAASDQDGEVARRLLKAAIHAAAENGLAGVVAPICDCGPFVDAYLDVEMQPGPRNNIVMALPLDVEGIVHGAWKSRFDPDLEVKVWTPRREFFLTTSERPSRASVLLEMKDDTLVKWVMGRLDLRARIREGSVTAVGANERIISALADALPFTPWVFHHLDYI